MQIIPFTTDHVQSAAALFVDRFQGLRREVPILPETLEDPQAVASRLGDLMQYSPGLAAVENGRLLGYMGWWNVDNFRDTGRRGSYSPVWGHGAVMDRHAEVYRALYCAAAECWAEAGLKTLAFSLLANDKAAEQFFFWNNFGLAVIDAIRPIQPLDLPAPRVAVHRARVEDALVVAELEVEHMRHYSQPPVWMTERHPVSAEGYAEFLSEERNGVWLAMDGDMPVGYLRFEGVGEGTSDMVHSDTTVAITGAYVREQARGKGAAGAILDAALRHYQSLGRTRCSVDFESFNPHALSFWLRYFTPVCLSLLRHPEAMLG